MFAKMIHNRLAAHLDSFQSIDQVRFRPRVGVELATTVFEDACGKMLEWDSELWVASVDVKKAFDRVEYDCLFAALSRQHVPQSYINLPRAICRGQVETVEGHAPFDIERGVQQGDVLSPLLCNVSLEEALSKWKVRVAGMGLNVSYGYGEVTGANYAEATRKLRGCDGKGYGQIVAGYKWVTGRYGRSRKRYDRLRDLVLSLVFGLLCNMLFEVRVTRFYKSGLSASALPPPRLSSSRSQWALPDFICQLQIPVVTAGLHPRAPHPSGHCRTSSASARSQWALPDFSRERQISVGTAGLKQRLPDSSGHCRTSAASSKAQWALPDINLYTCQIDCQKECQIECQKECQIECQIQC
eukprot:s443_g42.t1